MVPIRLFSTIDKMSVIVVVYYAKFHLRWDNVDNFVKKIDFVVEK